jgi:hypothetical protein
MYHNKALFNLNLNGCGIGDEDTVGFQQVSGGSSISTFNKCREGVSLRAMQLQIKFLMETEVDRPNVVFRYWIFEYNAMTADTVGEATFFCGTGGMNSVPVAMSRLIDDANPRTPMGIRVLRTGLIQHQPMYCDPAGGGLKRICTTTKFVNVPLNQKNTFLGTEATGSVTNYANLPIDHIYGVCIVAYDANDTLTTDKIGRVGMTSKVVFKEGS